jgi:glyoxylase-like metal-dependent hydrolase (beta-lactamase superfamily II)
MSTSPQNLSRTAGVSTPALRVGDITCTIIRDGTASYPAELVFTGADDQLMRAGLGQRLSDTDEVISHYDCALLETPTSRILIDTGLGLLAEVNGTPAGRLLASLADAGYRPEDIDVVLLSHAHPDHIGGLLTEGRPTFSRARHVMSSVEWYHWTAEASLAAMPEMMAAPARALLPPLDAAGCVDLIDGDSEVVPGVHLLPAPGHTPGHCVVGVTSAGASLVLLADAIIDELQFSHPEWTSAFDQLPEQTVATRDRLLSDAAASGSHLMAYHIGAFGQVELTPTGYAWNPLS